MTCYLRMHEVIVGVGPRTDTDWDGLLVEWNRTTSVADRDHLFARMPVVPIDVYQLAEADLSGLRGVVVSGRVDQEFLLLHRQVIRAFLDAGKVVAFAGQLLRPWLPGIELRPPVTSAAYEHHAVSRVERHPVFEGVDVADLGFSSSLGGYWDAGNRLPAGATVVLTTEKGQPVSYVDRSSSGGTIFAFYGQTLLGYATEENDSRRIVPQLLAWIDEEAA